MAELWSTGTFEQNDQQPSVEFKEAFGSDYNENGVYGKYAAVEGRAYRGFGIPDIGLPAE
jgi:hypothetical protein